MNQVLFVAYKAGAEGDAEERGEELPHSLAYFLPITTCAPLGRGLMRDEQAGSRTAAVAVFFFNLP